MVKGKENRNKHTATKIQGGRSMGGGATNKIAKIPHCSSRAGNAGKRLW